MAPSTPWADGPWQLIETPSATKSIIHPAHDIANQMAFAHNAIIRGLNAIYLQAPHIHDSRDISDFLFLTASWAQWLRYHHDMEEEFAFPAFNAVPGVKATSLQSNIDQHHEFAEGFVNLQTYAESTMSTPNEYSGARLRSIIEGFADTLRQHLADEIPTLWAMESVEANSPHSKKLEEIAKQMHELAEKSQDATVGAPMVLGLCDKTFEGGNDWPKLPMGAAYVVNYVFAWKHRGAWRFLPCDMWRNPRPLAFLGDDGAA